MSTELRKIGERRCIVASADGPPVRDAEGARRLIEAAMADRASVIAVSVQALDPAFFQLHSGIAGDVIQKVLNYKMKFVVIGDVSSYVAASDALRDFVIECNRGRDIFFAKDESELAEWLELIDRAVTNE